MDVVGCEPGVVNWSKVAPCVAQKQEVEVSRVDTWSKRGNWLKTTAVFCPWCGRECVLSIQLVRNRFLRRILCIKRREIGRRVGVI